MKNRKHYYENEINPTNTFKVPASAIETRGRFTAAQIKYLKFKYFWFGFGSGVALLTLAYIYMDLYLNLAK
jgi:hypothetical protein